MMGFCIAGGMLGNYDPDKDKEAAQRLAHKQHNPDYDPNPKGYFEHGPRNMWKGEARGYVTKRVFSQWNYKKMQKGHTVPPPLKVLCMYRPESERQASLNEFEWGPRGLEKRLKFRSSWDLWQQCHPWADILGMDYAQLVDRPDVVLGYMLAHKWPITNVKAAVDWIDPSLKRH